MRVTRNDSALDLANGDRFAVAAVSPTAITLDDGLRRVELRTDQPLYIDHAYATTIHSSQETTAERVLIDATTKSYQSPWQNGVAERFVGTVRRDLLDHVIVLDDEHLRRLLGEYLAYYHADRTHLGVRRTRRWFVPWTCALQAPPPYTPIVG